MQVLPHHTSFPRMLRHAFLAFMLVGIVSVSALSVYSWQREKQDVNNNLQVMAGFLSIASQAFFDNIAHGMQPMGQLLASIDVTGHPERARSYLLDFQRQHPEIGAMSIITPNGVMIINTAAKPGAPLPDYRNALEYMKHFKFALNDPYLVTIGRPEFGKILKEWRFPIRHTVRDASGQPLFMVQAAIPLEKSSLLLAEMPLPPGSIIGLIRNDGYQQIRWPAEESREVYSNPSTGPLASKLQSQPGLVYGIFSGVSPWADTRQQRIGAFYHLPRFDLTAYVSVPAQFIWKRWWQHNESVLLSFLIFLGIFGTIAFRVTVHEKRHSTELLRQAHKDPLTGLPNRAATEELLHAEIKHSAQAGLKFAVLFLDLDKFKDINDTLGHPVGDQLLERVAATVRNTLRRGDVLSRLGGDEFLIVLPDSNEKATLTAVERILKEFQQPFQLEHHALHVTPSIGIAVYPDHGEDVETLLKHADTAMYAAKQQGRNGYAFYIDQLGQKIRHRIELEHRLREALEQDEFRLYYQPVVDMTNGTIIGAEALLRWQDPQNGLRAPVEFIHIAEESGLILPLGEWVFRAACLQAQEWARRGYNLFVAVNLSTHQFQDPHLPEKIATVLKETGLEPSRLEIEVTESAAMRDPEASIQILTRMKDMGLNIAIDDFGTGYSSLNYLKRIPADKVKIDKSFVAGIGANTDDTAIVRTILSLAVSMDKVAVAEGIETHEQYQELRTMGCTAGQGYWMSKPVPPEDFPSLIEKHQV